MLQNFVVFVTFIVTVTNKKVNVCLNRHVIDQKDRRSFRNEFISPVDISVIEQRYYHRIVYQSVLLDIPQSGMVVPCPKATGARCLVTQCQGRQCNRSKIVGCYPNLVSETHKQHNINFYLKNS